MISKLNRFHTQGALHHTYAQGATVRLSDISLKYAANTRSSAFRVAVVVSKKVTKSAVKRNRIRRRIYEIIRRHATHIKPSHDLIFTVYKEEILAQSPGELEETIHSCLKRADLLE